MVELSKEAEFGKLSEGIFHDLMNPLTSVALQIEELGKISGAGRTIPEITQIQENVQNAVFASKRMGLHMSTIRKSINSGDEHMSCSISDAIQHVLKLLEYKIRNADIKIDTNGSTDTEVKIPCNSLYLERVLLNLSFESLDGSLQAVTNLIRAELPAAESFLAARMASGKLGKTS